MKYPLSALLLTLALPLSTSAQEGGCSITSGNPSQAHQDQMACGRVTVKEIQELFALVLKMSGYDNTLDDQKPYGKPKREKTTPIYHEISKITGSPAAAVSAYTGSNSKESNPKGHKSSHVIIDAPAIAEFAQTRGQVVWLFGHEVAHLLKHHPEEQEKERLKQFEEWYAKMGAWYQHAPVEKVKAAFLKETEKKWNEFIKSQEREADEEANAFVKLLDDPKTKRKFEEDAGDGLLDSAKQWLEAKGESTGDAHHGTLDERIAHLQTVRQHDASLRAGQQQVGNALVGAGKELNPRP